MIGRVVGYKHLVHMVKQTRRLSPDRKRKHIKNCVRVYICLPARARVCVCCVCRKYCRRVRKILLHACVACFRFPRFIYFILSLFTQLLNMQLSTHAEFMSTIFYIVFLQNSHSRKLRKYLCKLKCPYCRVSASHTWLRSLVVKGDFLCKI